METANLCQCTKCNTVMIDQNPQTGAAVLPIPDNAVDMQYMDDKSGGFWSCPVCETDSYLIDLPQN